MKKYLTIEEADTLFEKYYNGETTNMEEVLLHDFLMQEDLPERFEAERAMFGYFAEEKKQLIVSDEVRMVIDSAPSIQELTNNETRPSRNIWLRPVLRWSIAAAVLISAVFVFDTLIQAQNNNVAYVNGIRCTDSREVSKLAIASIDQMNLGADEVAVEFEKMNDGDLVESQLQLFSEIE